MTDKPNRERCERNPPPLECEVIPLRHGLDAFIAERRVANKEVLAMHHARVAAEAGEPVQLSLDVDPRPVALPRKRRDAIPSR